MNDELKDTKDFLQNISDNIHYFVRDSLPDNWVFAWTNRSKISISSGFGFMLPILFLKFILNQIFRTFFNDDKYPIQKSIYQSRITNSVAHLIALLFWKFCSVLHILPTSKKFYFS